MIFIFSYFIIIFVILLKIKIGKIGFRNSDLIIIKYYNKNVDSNI